MKKNIIGLLFLTIGLTFTAVASWDYDTFNENSHSLTRALAKNKEIDLAQKQALLWDLITCENREIFAKKYDALEWNIKTAESAIFKEIHKASKGDRAKRENLLKEWAGAKRELSDLKNKAALVDEDFHKALAIEYNTGKRPEPKLRFEIAAAEPQKTDKFDPNTFIGKINIFISAMLENKTIDTASYKKAILWELLTTEHYENFDKMYGELEYLLKGNTFSMGQLVLATRSREEYESAMTRQKELEDLLDKAKLVRSDFFEVYYNELVKGKKPAYKFSFEIKPISWQIPKENQATSTFTKEWEEASQVVGGAFSALEDKNQARFAGFWSKESKPAEIKSTYDHVQKFFLEKGRYYLYPLYMTSKVYLLAERFEDTGIMTVGVRVWGAKRIYTKGVLLIKEGGRYKIQSWWMD